MKPLILHGPALNSSRRKLSDIKGKFDPSNIIVFEKGADIKDILAQIQTVSMFDNERLVVIENATDDFLNQLSNYTLTPNPSTLILWFDKEIDAKKLPKEAEMLFFPEAKEASIFPLLDLLAAKNPKAFLELSNLRKGNFDTQYLITMIFYLLRSLTVTPKNAPPFVRQKLERQRQNFSPETLKNLYKFVLETDFKIKSGLMETVQAEFSLVTKFLGSV